MPLPYRRLATLAFTLTATLVTCTLLARQAAGPAGKVRKTTVIGSVYEVDPRFEKAITANIVRGRQEIRKHRDAGQFVAYLSTPISPRGGGHEPTNLAISAAV